MVADIEILRKKLAEMDTYVNELQKLQIYSLDELKGNLTNLWSVAHGLACYTNHSGRRQPHSCRPGNKGL